MSKIAYDPDNNGKLSKVPDGDRLPEAPNPPDDWRGKRYDEANDEYLPAQPSGDEAYAEMEKYLRDKYTLNEWANMMDANPILIELIKNEEYQKAVDRADYLANDDNSLVDSEDADKLREVTKV